MTTVAYKDGLMSCDSQWSYGGRVDTRASKLIRLSSGAILGQSGQNDARSIVDAFDKVKTPKQFPSYDALMALRANFLGLLVLPTGQIFKVATTLVTPENWTQEFEESVEDLGVWEINGGMAAVGSGGELALVAMECGKNARDAVSIACKYDLWSSHPVFAMHLDTKPPAKTRKRKGK